jgi:hypothetical protein
VAWNGYFERESSISIVLIYVDIGAGISVKLKSNET